MKIHPAAVAGVLALYGSLPASPTAPQDKASANAAVRSVMEVAETLREVPLREVIEAATGHRVVVFTPDGAAADAACRKHVTAAADELLKFLNGPDSPAKGLRRINEVSHHAEDRLLELLNKGDFACALPRNSQGGVQRSGYPDLQLTHKPSGRRYYLDPKLYEAGAETSTLRTFYYEPRELTGKIQHDACHLLLGIAHDGKDGSWQFTRWKLVDLYHFRVRLKAEFQGSNRDLYQPELTVAESEQR